MKKMNIIRHKDGPISKHFYFKNIVIGFMISPINLRSPLLLLSRSGTVIWEYNLNGLRDQPDFFSAVLVNHTPI